jgi:hypothetical protein
MLADRGHHLMLTGLPKLSHGYPRRVLAAEPVAVHAQTGAPRRTSGMCDGSSRASHPAAAQGALALLRKAVLHSIKCRLRPVQDPEFGQDGADVAFHGPLADA